MRIFVLKWESKIKPKHPGRYLSRVGPLNVRKEIELCLCLSRFLLELELIWNRNWYGIESRMQFRMPVECGHTLLIYISVKKPVWIKHLSISGHLPAFLQSCSIINWTDDFFENYQRMGGIVLFLYCTE